MISVIVLNVFDDGYPLCLHFALNELTFPNNNSWGCSSGEMALKVFRMYTDIDNNDKRFATRYLMGERNSILM